MNLPGSFRPGTQFATPQKIVNGELSPLSGPLTYDACSWVDARVMQIDGTNEVTIAVGAAAPSIGVAEGGAGQTWTIGVGKPTDRHLRTSRAFTRGPATATGWAVVEDQGRPRVVAWSNELFLDDG
jgi:hypothetical protein